MNDHLVGFIGACLIHLSLFFLGGKVLLQPAQYGIQVGTGGVEVNLVSAPADTNVEQIKPPAPTKQELSQTLEKDAVVVPEPVEEKKEKVDTRIHGDGTSSTPGKDATTLHTVGGALFATKSDYFRNPAPPYPELARQMKQQGLVMLIVDVDREGKPTKVEIEQSSGYRLLDQAAQEAVTRWKFQPARVDGVTIESKVRVPIRFRLED